MFNKLKLVIVWVTGLFGLVLSTQMVDLVSAVIITTIVVILAIIVLNWIKKLFEGFKIGWAISRGIKKQMDENTEVAEATKE